MARLLLVSNGHGEDLSGALLGKELQRQGHQVDAIPFVGRGSSYLDAGIKIIGKVKQFSTGGLGYTSLHGRLTELLQGQVLYLAGRLLRLLFLAPRYDLLVAIGDVVPVFATWLTRKPVVTYLVAYSSHYEGKLKLPWPCSNCLLSPHFLAIYSRDKLTADDLSDQLRRKVNFLGNPFMDIVLNSKSRLPEFKSRLGLLPGSRRPELDENILLLLDLMRFLAAGDFMKQNISLDMALVPALDDHSLKNLAEQAGWQLIEQFDKSNPKQLVLGQFKINIQRGCFAQVLQSSDLLVSMAGTAAEQAVGLAKPVIQLPGYGPQFTVAFAEAQRRLLGPTIFCAEGNPGELITFSNTARLIVNVLQQIQEDKAFQRECSKQAMYRLGGAGGGRLMAKAITDLIVKHTTHYL